MIKIITDTASDITLQQARKMDVTLLTLPVTFGETLYDQLSDENFTKFYDMLEQSESFPVTSLSAPGEYFEIFEAAKKNGDTVVVIPISSQLSGSYQSACLAKDMSGYGGIYIVDGRQALIGQRLLVEHAVKLRDDGLPAEEIASRVSEVSTRVRLYGALDTLKYLIKGGRISKSAGLIGSAFNIKPIVCLHDGSVTMAGKARGRSGALKALTQFIGSDFSIDSSFPFCFGYTKNSEQLIPFAQSTKEMFNLQNTATYPVGGVVGAHIGPDAIAVVWVAKK